MYILQCVDQTYYIGFTQNLAHRLHVHNQTRGGAKYTRSRRPVLLVYIETYTTQGEALRREYALKQWSRSAKQALIATITPDVALHVHQLNEGLVL